MDSWLVNRKGTIWVFCQKGFFCEYVGESPQHLTLKLTSQLLSTPVYFSFVHAKCTEQERALLWSTLLDDNPTNDPWLLAGDFNVIISKEEKRGGQPVRVDDEIDCEHLWLWQELVMQGSQGRGLHGVIIEEVIIRQMIHGYWQGILMSSLAKRRNGGSACSGG